jgi:hypothetical protein
MHPRLGRNVATTRKFTLSHGDRYYTGGLLSTRGQKTNITGTHFPTIYQTARMMTKGGAPLWYTLPIPHNINGYDGQGEHGWHFVLTLKFVEVTHNNTGKRVFGINLNGLQVLTGIDIVEEAGFAHAYDVDIEFLVDIRSMLMWVTDVGALHVRMEQPATFAFELHVGITSQHGNARVSGLEVTQGRLAAVQDERQFLLDTAAGRAPKRRAGHSNLDQGMYESEGAWPPVYAGGGLLALLLLIGLLAMEYGSSSSPSSSLSGSSSSSARELGRDYPGGGPRGPKQRCSTSTSHPQVLHKRQSVRLSLAVACLLAICAV